MCCHHAARMAWARSAMMASRFELVKLIQSTETAIFALLYLLIYGKIFKTSVIQSVELHEYYNFAIMIKA